MVGIETIRVRRKNKQSTRDRGLGERWGCHVYMVMEELSNEEISKQELKEHEGANHVDTWGESTPTEGIARAGALKQDQETMKGLLCTRSFWRRKLE